MGGRGGKRTSERLGYAGLRPAVVLSIPDPLGRSTFDMAEESEERI
jgi:hypothetical protein